jgi:DNA-binding response OmpR family regulator
MSGYSEHAITGRLELTGAYLPKPFSPEDLAVKVRSVLGPPRPAGTILVVDDEPGIRNLLRKLLTGVSYRVREAPGILFAVLPGTWLDQTISEWTIYQETLYRPKE